MSTSYSARALIGVRLPRADVIRAERVKAFKHGHPPSWKVDPESGNALWKTQLRCVLLPFDPDYTMGCDLSCVEPRKEIEGLYLFDDGSGEWFLLGDLAVQEKGYASRPDPRAFKPIPMGLSFESWYQVTSDKIARVLAKAGVPFDRAKMGLHVMLYVSA